MELPAMARFLMVLVVAIAGGCSLAPAAQPTVTLQPTATPQPTITPGPTAPPTATATPSPPSPPTDTASTQPIPTEPVDGGGTLPPQGTIAVGTASTSGLPGSYCYGDTCADRPITPPKADLPEVVLPSTHPEIDFSVSAPARFVEWHVYYSRTSNGDVTTLTEGGSYVDPDATPPPTSPEISSVTFAPPPSGDWVLFVRVGFHPGDASYTWHLIVP